MSTFNYQDIDNGNIKIYITNAFKLFFRRPLFSFLPFVILSFLSFFIFNSDMFFLGTAFFYLIIELLLPIIGAEMSYANDYSKKPFSKISHFQEFKTNPVYKEMLQRVAKLCLSFLFIYTVLHLIPSEPTNTQAIPEIKETKDFSYFIYFIIPMSSLLFGFILLTAYQAIFEFCLIFLPRLIKNVPQCHQLIVLKNQAFAKNKMVFSKILFPIGFFQCLIFLIILKFSLIISLAFFFIILGVAISLCYIIAKDMSGGGTKLEEKQSLLNKIFQKQNKFSESY